MEAYYTRVIISRKGEYIQTVIVKFNASDPNNAFNKMKENLSLDKLMDNLPMNVLPTEVKLEGLYQKLSEVPPESSFEEIGMIDLTN